MNKRPKKKKGRTNAVTEEPDTFSYKEASSLQAEAVAFLSIVM